MMITMFVLWSVLSLLWIPVSLVLRTTYHLTRFVLWLVMPILVLAVVLGVVGGAMGGAANWGYHLFDGNGLMVAVILVGLVALLARER